MQNSRGLVAALVFIVVILVQNVHSESCFDEDKAKADFGEPVATCKEELKMPPGPPKRFNPKEMIQVGKCVLGKKDALNDEGLPDKAKVRELITPYIKSENQEAILKTYEKCMPEKCTEDGALAAMGCIMMGYKKWGCEPCPGFKMPSFPGM